MLSAHEILIQKLLVQFSTKYFHGIEAVLVQEKVSCNLSNTRWWRDNGIQVFVVLFSIPQN
jgi:hypothetical protein